jgi:hypothetical protein
MELLNTLKREPAEGPGEFPVIARLENPSETRSRQTTGWLSRAVARDTVVGLVLLCVALVGVATAQTPASASPAAGGRDPKPEDATRAILAAFDTYQVVGMLAGHGMKDVDDFILSLIRHPAFPNAVHDIVVECSNSSYQPTLDRYIAGDDVPLAEVRQVWRNTQPGCVSAFHEELFPLVRRINQRLPSGKRLRVLAGEPPVDWNLVKSESEATSFLSSRDAHMALVMEKEVFAKHRKALLLYGTGHLRHGLGPQGWGLGVALYEKHYPGVTLVIDVHGTGPGCDLPISKRYGELEARLAAWPVPSLARVKDTWLATVEDITGGPTPPGWPRWSVSIDAYLYLGPRDLLLYEPAPAHVWLDTAYLAELRRRASIPGAATPRARDQLDPEKVREREANPLFCDSGRSR